MTKHYLDDSLLAQLSQKTIITLQVEDRSICITKFKDKVFAFLNRCPHASAPLQDGFIDAFGNIVCPLHHYRFSLKNGLSNTDDGSRLKTFKVIQEEDNWYLEL